MLQILTADPEDKVKDFLQPWQLLLLFLAGWMNCRQQDVIEYLLVEKPGVAAEAWEKANSVE